MLRIDNLNDNRVLTLTASGKLTKKDYEQLLPQLEDMFDRHGTLRFYIRLDNISGIDAGALWDEIKFDYKHKNQFGKTAIVGDSKWEEWTTTFSRMFFDCEMRFFYTDKAIEAWKWVNS